MSIEKIKKLREMSGAGLLDVKNALEATNYEIDEAVKWLRENGISKAAKKAGRTAGEGVIFSSSSPERGVIIEINSETDFVAKNEKFINAGQLISDAILNSNSKDVESAYKIKINNETVDQIITNLTATIGEKITLRRISFVSGENANYIHSNKRIGVIVCAEKMNETILRDIAMHIAAMNPQYLSMDEIPEDKIELETNLAKKELKDIISAKPEKISQKIIKGKVQKILSELVLLEQSFVKDSSKKISDLQKDGKLISFTRFEVGEGIEKKQGNFAEEVKKQAQLS